MLIKRIRIATLVLILLCLSGGLVWSIGSLELLPEKLWPQIGQVEQILPQTMGPTTVQAAQTGQTTTTATTSSVVITQTFALAKGWNTIYLEIEPANPSKLVNRGTEQEPFMVHEKSTIDAILGDVAGLESVWAWNVPLSTVDYIVDPAEGLWDEPGWKRYIHDSVTGADGKSQGFLTNLVNLHANTGYLIKMADNVTPTTVTLAGTPKVLHKRWVQNSYNLAGFPLLPTASPTVAGFIAGSPLTELMKLESDGTWVKMASSETLAYGKAYLAYHDSSRVNANALNYTAPLDIMDPLADGMAFLPGLGGRNQSFRIQNLSGVAADVTMTFTRTNGAGVALRLTAPTTQTLTTGDATLSLAAGAAAKLDFTVRSTEQSADGAGLLEISSPTLGVRRLVPVTAKSGSRAGLWVGDVTVNDVSESRLGGTNVADGNLTVALRSINDSGVSGSVVMQEQVAGSDSSVTMSVTLNLPGLDVVPTQALTGTPPYVTGYVFVDLNQNGQRDGDEPGLANQTVTLGGATTKTGTDGRYLFQGLGAGSEAISADIPADYTTNFGLILPPNHFTQETAPQFVTVKRDRVFASLNGTTLLSPNSLFVVSMSQRGEIVVTNTNTQQVVWQSPGHTSELTNANALWQFDGNLVVYSNEVSGGVVWASNTPGVPNQKELRFTDNGMLEIYNDSTGQQLLWNSTAPPLLTQAANVAPTNVTVNSANITAVSPPAYLSQVLPGGRQTLPYIDVNDNRVEPTINFGVVASHSASLRTGTCSQSSQDTDLGAVTNGRLNHTVASASLNPRSGSEQLVGGTTNYVVMVADAAGNNVACGEIRVGSPTRLANGEGSEFSFRVILRVKSDGTTELLPYYERGRNTPQEKRISSANVALRDSLSATTGSFNNTLAFNLTVAPNHPLNPFKHKYHPDHDNLDRAFLPMNSDTVNPNLWESYNLVRGLRLTQVDRLSDIPAFANRPSAEITQFETEVDWGGSTWGGLYQEVMRGVHKNDITVQGYFIVRHVLQADQLEVQDYDQ